METKKAKAKERKRKENPRKERLLVDPHDLVLLRFGRVSNPDTSKGRKDAAADRAARLVRPTEDMLEKPGLVRFGYERRPGGGEQAGRVQRRRVLVERGGRGGGWV